jgi:hypothetical protein
MNRCKLLCPSSVLAALALVLPVRAETPLRQVIDTEVKAAWQREKITPAARADDAAFDASLFFWMTPFSTFKLSAPAPPA